VPIAVADECSGDNVLGLDTWGFGGAVLVDETSSEAASGSSTHTRGQAGNRQGQQASFSLGHSVAPLLRAARGASGGDGIVTYR
jgi:hypothetical protein